MGRVVAISDGTMPATLRGQGSSKPCLVETEHRTGAVATAWEWCTVVMRAGFGEGVMKPVPVPLPKVWAQEG